MRCFLVGGVTMERKNSFEGFFGEHIFSGIELTHEIVKDEYENENDCNICLFTIEGETYKLVENPGDGYRSWCEEIKVSDRKPKYTFDGVRVLCRALPNYDCNNNDCMEIIDIKNGKTILIIGTKNYDDYYPYCCFEWTPENMSCNEGKQ